MLKQEQNFTNVSTIKKILKIYTKSENGLTKCHVLITLKQNHQINMSTYIIMHLINLDHITNLPEHHN